MIFMLIFIYIYCFQIASSGVDLTMLKSPQSLVRQNGSELITETSVTKVTKSSVSSATVAKRPKIDSCHQQQFDVEVEGFSEWLEKTELNLEILTTEPADHKDRLTLEEQMVLISVSVNTEMSQGFI